MYHTLHPLFIKIAVLRYLALPEAWQTKPSNTYTEYWMK